MGVRGGGGGGGGAIYKLGGGGGGGGQYINWGEGGSPSNVGAIKGILNVFVHTPEMWTPC